MRPAFEQLRNKHNLIGAEIGVYYGDYTSIYLEELDIEKVFLIDPYTKHVEYTQHTIEILKEAEEEAYEKLKVYEDKIIWMKVQSVEAVDSFADESLDFVYIDGNHLYQFALEDITLYYPKVKKGGLLSGHDYIRKAANHVFGAVNDFCRENNLELNHSEGKNPDWWFWK